MPSFGRAIVAIEGGTASFVPPIVRFGGGSITIAGGTDIAFKIGNDPSASAVTVPELDYLDASQPIVDAQGRPTAQFQFLIQQHVDRIIAAFVAVDERDTDQDSILARLTAAETLARTANDSATAAQSAATTAAQQANAASQAVADTFGQVDPTLSDYYAGRYDDYYYA